MTEDPQLFATPTTPKRWQDIPTQHITTTFTLWATLHQKRNPKLTPERHRKIAQAIHTHGLTTVHHAIHGALLSDWHMGRNPQQKKYNDISLILRNAEKIEHFAELHENSHNAGGFLDD